ncbi:MAG: hypothetical protein WA208_01005, partial [Thermoanaerobaculia bacterium]
MKKTLLILLILVALPAAAQLTTARIADDAIVIDRVVELTARDLPGDLLRRIVADDIEALRGPRPDGTYAYARLERLEGGRKNESFSISARGDRFTTAKISGSNVYRVQLDSPNRKLLVARNRPVYVERIDIEYVAEPAAGLRSTSIEVKGVINPGEVRVIDLPFIARQATVRAQARAETEGYGNLVVSLLEARIVDEPSSPYADAVASAKAIQRGIEQKDVASIRAMAQRMRRSLQPQAPQAAVDVVAPRPVEA